MTPKNLGPPGDRADADLDAAASRLRAWRAQVSPVAPPPPGDDEVGGPADELVERLAARRSARHVAAAYAAAHGHPLDGGSYGAAGGGDDGGDGGRRRWAVGLRTAVVASVAVLTLGIGAAVVASQRPQEVVTLAAAEPAPSVGPTAADEAAPSDDPTTPSSPPAVAAPRVVVHVVGEVREPGLVTLAEGDRVADAVEAAGGATGKADTAALNLARTVLDGEQIVVPRPGEAVPGGATAEGSTPEGSTAEGSTQDGSGDGGTTAGGSGAPVDLNAASASELDSLPGIGPVLAERIVTWRDENGPFTSVDELEEVSGIGPSVLEDVRALVLV